MKHTCGNTLRGEQNRRGSSLVEFALGLPVLVTVVVLLAQVGYALYAYSTLSAAIREGAHFAASADFDEPGRGFTKRVKNIVVYGEETPSNGSKPRIPDLTAESISVSWQRDVAGAPRQVTVSLREFEMPGPANIIRLKDRPSATFPFSGRWRTVPAAPASHGR